MIHKFDPQTKAYNAVLVKRFREKKISRSQWMSSLGRYITERMQCEEVVNLRARWEELQADGRLVFPFLTLNG